MATLVALYKHPADVESFHEHYFQVHVPLAKRIPGLREYAVSDGPVTAPTGSSPPYHLVAMLTFGSVADLKEGLQSTEGQEAVSDLANFAGAGVDILVFETRQP